MPDDLALGGMVVPGQIVDVFVTAVVNITDPTGVYVADRSTKITYQDVVILARTGSFYIIRASLAVAEEIAHLQATGSATFSFALRPGADQRIMDVSSLGETTNRIIEKYGLPFPESLSPGLTPLPSPSSTPAPSASPGASPAPPPPRPRRRHRAARPTREAGRSRASQDPNHGVPGSGTKGPRHAYRNPAGRRVGSA